MMAEKDPNYWVIVGSRENYEISKARGFDVQGIKSRMRKKALTLQPGDKAIYYLTGLKVMPGVITVTSEVFEEKTRIWPCSSTGADGEPEIYPYRFHAEPHCIIENPEDWVSVTDFYEELEYLKKWPAKNWTLGFQGNLHQWPAHDFERVEKRIRAAASSVKVCG